MAQQRRHSDPAALGIERVLEAERLGEQKLRDARQQAQAALASARARAEAIGRRADTRIAKLHASYRQQIEREIAALAPPAAEPSKGPDDVAAWKRAAKRVASKLTGAEGEPPG